MSDLFYEAIQQPNAILVDAPIQRIEPEGVRTADGALHELDVLVLATGFRVDRFIRPTKVLGRGGRDLDDAWSQSPTAYISMTVPDFPNLFLVNGPNSPFGNFSAFETAEHQIADIQQRLIAGLQNGDYREVSPTKAALDAFEAERRKAGEKTVWVTGCNSWYLDKEGVPASWTFSFDRFVQETETPRMADYETR
ncbi:MAG: hypothetical protein QM703_28415 [Gemmatales bacterium]